MKQKTLLLIAGTLLHFSVSAQWKGLTGQPDTSFTVNGTYARMKKDYPEMRIPSSEVPAGVNAKYGVSYAQPAGKPLQLDIFYPKQANRKSPAVLVIFGGGWRSGERTQLRPLAIELAKKGFVAVAADYRLSTEALYPAAVDDLKNALKWMRSNAGTYQIDTSKIATLGFSAGGQLAALVGFTDHVRAVVDIDGIVAFIHPESGEGDDSKSISAATNWFGGNKTEKKALWEEASPLRYVNAQSPPVLFINSSVDRMHAGREDMIAKLKSHNIYSEVHTFQGAPHVFPLFHPWFDPTVSYVTKFLEKVLK